MIGKVLIIALLLVHIAQSFPSFPLYKQWYAPGSLYLTHSLSLSQSLSPQRFPPWQEAVAAPDSLLDLQPPGHTAPFGCSGSSFSAVNLSAQLSIVSIIP